MPDGEGGIDLWVATQWVHHDRDQVAACLGLLLGLHSAAVGSLITFGTAGIYVAFLLVAYFRHWLLALTPLARATATQDTWSGIMLGWPVQGTGERLPVEMSGLPIFDRGRGFRMLSDQLAQALGSIEELTSAQSLAQKDLKEAEKVLAHVRELRAEFLKLFGYSGDYFDWRDFPHDQGKTRTLP